MGNYYFLGSLLPSLSFEEKPEISLLELVQLFPGNLSEKDLEKTIVIRRLIDIYNLRAYWSKQLIDRRGNMDENELESAVVSQITLPAYINDFMEKYDSAAERIHYFPLLIHQFFAKEINYATGFLKKYLTFERNLRLVLAAFRAKALGKDVAVELQFEDPHDPIVAHILAQKDAKSYDPAEGFESLKSIFDQHYESPLQLQEAIAKYRFEEIEEMIEGDVFSIDRILSYMIQLMIVEQWHELQTQEGLLIVDSILKEAK